MREPGSETRAVQAQGECDQFGSLLQEECMSRPSRAYRALLPGLLAVPLAASATTGTAGYVDNGRRPPPEDVAGCVSSAQTPLH